MSGTIVLDEREKWSASSGVFNWVVEFLAAVVEDPGTKDELTLIEEQNFGWLDCAQLSAQGRREVLDSLGAKLVPYAEHHFPDTPTRDDAIDLMARLSNLALAVGH
jgi:hypothetical protein